LPCSISFDRSDIIAMLVSKQPRHVKEGENEGWMKS
jgi:hypothetical protein